MVVPSVSAAQDAAANPTTPDTNLPSSLGTHLVVDTIDATSAHDQISDSSQIAELLSDLQEDKHPSGDLDPEQSNPERSDIGSAGLETAVGDSPATPSGKIRVCFDSRVPEVIRQEAIQAATSWDEAIAVEGPDIEIDFYWLDLENPNVLGAGGPMNLISNVDLPHPQARYPVALANELLGFDHAPRQTCDHDQPGEIALVLNSHVGRGGWRVGDTPLIDGKPTPSGTPTGSERDSTDVQTTILHELGHGFGHIGSAELDSASSLAWPEDGLTPMVFDLFARLCDHESATGCKPSDSRAISIGDLSALTSSRLWFDTGLGPLLELEAPLLWDSGSSFSHLDEYRYPSSSDYALMTPYIGVDQEIRALDNATVSVMQTLGWKLAINPAPIAVNSIAAGDSFLTVNLRAPDLTAGPPPAGYTISVDRIESNSSGQISTIPVRQSHFGPDRSASLTDLAPGVLYQLHLTPDSAQASLPTISPGPVLIDAATLSPAETDSFVANSHLAILGRPPTVAENTKLRDILTDGGVQPFVSELEQSFESTQQVAVARLYLGYLNRLPDYLGLRFWLELLRGPGGSEGVSLDQLANAFVGATNFETNGPLTDSEYVVRVYQSILGRDPESPGLQFWTGRLIDGASRGRILLEISESDEHRSLDPGLPEVLVAYTLLEGRIPSSDEIKLWTRSEGLKADLLAALLTGAI